MISIENIQFGPLEPVVRGMRNPMNSWERSDSSGDEVGQNDFDLMRRLAAGGSVHAKYRRMMVVFIDITAPLYWWKEFDTYKVGTVANSCSTMHKIQENEFKLDDFSHEHLLDLMDQSNELDDFPEYNHEFWDSKFILGIVVKALNFYRKKYNKVSEKIKTARTQEETSRLLRKQKRYWWQMIQLLPSSYNQKRTVMLNYEVLHNMYISRKDHKLDEWREFCKWIETLPYSDLITVVG